MVPKVMELTPEKKPHTLKKTRWEPGIILPEKADSRQTTFPKKSKMNPEK